MLKCEHCDGVGAVPLGGEMLAKRRAAKVTACLVAERMGISATYLSDLELGRRGWTADLAKRYDAALGVQQQQQRKEKHEKETPTVKRVVDGGSQGAEAGRGVVQSDLEHGSGGVETGDVGPESSSARSGSTLNNLASAYSRL
jgi:hypothetical protein